MSKHWRPVPRARRRAAVTAGEIRLTLLGGIAAGLAWAMWPASGVAELGQPGGTRVEDPWAVGIIDGDTFRYRGEKIRVADIDTPETHPPRCAYEAELGARATARMATLLRQGPFELMPIDRDEDVYGRKLRVVTRGGRSLGDQLVAEGLARTWSGHREPWC